MAPISALYITGLGSQYPHYILTPEKLDEFAERFSDVSSPGVKKLLQINRSTGIETRSAIHSYEDGFATQEERPSVRDLDQFFRQAGVDLAVQACQKALQEAHITPEQITHTVGVTCTNHGSPGYDLLVVRQLGLSPQVDRMLLHGVGCAGGLSIMRAAAQIASGASLRRKSARILAFACELSGALFSDAAAAFILCNEYAMAKDENVTPVFELVEWGTSFIPDTIENLSFYADIDGYRTVLSRDVSIYAKNAIKPMFESLLLPYKEKISPGPGAGGEGLQISLGSGDFDWALHPGGQTIIKGAQQVLQLRDDQLQASREIYRTRGNSSSATVLIVLDRLRTLGKKEHIVATSFGPGMTIEMAILRRCETPQ
ncbi:uncharacterized protein N7446_007221 [Penicillium canescens]|uniref:Uncharacterized protein n=1 Tax=Penicillium canescens TaxID=5083 RepID=A0AAD6IL99_PENCN|nr:uncharacterized protein N7446_007221 [Penicillium canescens]KAJ6052581.1 hypothetical protein N7460_003115 [Penicillium canescens]KAJ6063101.1 hypothetical protein N7446_007221 [Penicillium canescens]